MAELPLELFRAIAKEAEKDPSIFALRLVSKTANSVVTPFAFRVVVVRDSVRSAAAVSFLQSCEESVAPLVREVIFHGDPVGHTPGDWRDETSEEDGRNALKTAFSGLAKFPNLQNLRLTFHDTYQESSGPDFPPEDSSHFLLLQNEILAALAANPVPSGLVSLTLDNLIAVPNDIYYQDNFHRLFRPLKDLAISVISDESEGWYFQDPIVEFWNHNVAHIVRNATSVTSLTIKSSQPVGAYPALSFENTFLPHLASLTLHGFVLEPGIPDSDVATFIIRHKATLAHLELRDCSIDGGEDLVFQRPWHAVLRLFQVELGCLREFVFGGPDLDGNADAVGRDPQFEYTRLDLGWGYMTCEEEEVEGKEQDLSALERLLAVVRSRN
ncbi:hypothetical protein C8F04DRAFT_100617 [Mycena alexandri]|uniref:F-box domain-containing protein n=1 Tax=Mycena alexandri TaxID=1745969 RepID=A0AAD6SGX2_9AGAR|nr:hypothetical protein C8F04DRAFT_100617 [Mycena alexandri]